jgi:predicted DCC family thiol-disulfide oxidoreductase YuxK
MKLPCNNLILFDGVCNFCASSVRFIIRHDKHAIFKFVSIQSQLGKDIYKSYGLDLDNMQTFLVLTNGQFFCVVTPRLKLLGNAVAFGSFL